MNILMNQYINQIHLICDDITKHILQSSIANEDNLEKLSIIVNANKFLVDIQLRSFDVEKASQIMNTFVNKTHYSYSAYYTRFNEGNQVRYRYATCKENREGFYCDIIIK